METAGTGTFLFEDLEVLVGFAYMCPAGSYALVGAKVPEDATVVAKLRQNGAVILGKTSLSQWYNLRSTNSSDGWNARGGQSYGAYYPEQNPSGSSSGSAVSADLGLALATLGTEVSVVVS